MMPASFVVYFARRQDRHAASVALWWVGQNLWNISVYVRDARAQELPLVGGGDHDWAYLLGRFGWLQSDQVIAHDIWFVGVVVYVLAIGGGRSRSRTPRRPSLRVIPGNVRPIGSTDAR